MLNEATKVIPAAETRPVLSPGHGTSLSTTAGITSVITGVMAASFAAQTPPVGSPELACLLACATVGALLAGAAALYAARNAVGRALDAAGGPGAARLSAQALGLYHLGMACVFAGLACAATWRLAVPHGLYGWLGAGLAALIALRALVSAATQLKPALKA